jgi:hypothetical protein
VYDLCLHSDIPIPGLPEGGRAPDLVIRQAPLDPSALGTGTQGGDRVTGHYEGRLLVEVEGGERITVHPLEPVSEETIRAYATSVLLAIALRQRGLCLFHASCVARDGVAVAFVGESGWGKSTLAEAFLQRGYSVLTDDILALDLSGEGARVLPGPPYIRLRPGAAAALMGSEYDAMPAVSSLGDQRMRTVERGAPEPAMLRRVYILDPDDAEENALVPLSPSEATMNLVVHSWGKRAFTDPKYTMCHLRDCAALVRSMPIQRLRRVRSLDALADHVALVERDLASEVVPVAASAAGLSV